MIIDCHGHYTTAPKPLRDWRQRQIDALKDSSLAPKAPPVISDDEIRESLEGAQLQSMRDRGVDLTFFSPIAGVIPPEATAPALVIVGYFMMSTAAEIDWKDPGIGIPVLLTIIVMPFTYSITNGVGAGFLAYVLIAVLRGKAREVHPLLYVVAAIFAWYFIHGVV